MFYWFAFLCFALRGKPTQSGNEFPWCVNSIIAIFQISEDCFVDELLAYQWMALPLAPRQILLSLNLPYHEHAQSKSDS